jgi:hypothetical protein
MKHIFCCLLACLISSTTWAQLVKPPKPSPFPSEFISGWQRMADSLLAPLDKSRITIGILYDRVSTIARLDVFEPADTSDCTRFQPA